MNGEITLEEDIDLLFPLDGSGEIVALRCYIDAGENGQLIYSVAGVTFADRPAKRAERKWRDLLGERIFHMTDLHSRRGDFEGIGDAERDAIIRGVAGIIAENTNSIVCVSFDSKEIEPSLPRASAPDNASMQLLKGLRKKYCSALHSTMYLLGSMANIQSGNTHRKLSYVFEHGDDGQGDFIDYLRFMIESPFAQAQLDSFSLNQYTVRPKGCGPGIMGAADFIAWEWARHLANRPKNIPTRKSLIAALSGEMIAFENRYGSGFNNLKSKFLFHYSGDYFSQALGFQSELLQEDRDISDILDRFIIWRDQR